MNLHANNDATANDSNTVDPRFVTATARRTKKIEAALQEEVSARQSLESTLSSSLAEIRSLLLKAEGASAPQAPSASASAPQK